MRKLLVPLMLIAAPALTGCLDTPAKEDKGLEEGFSMINDHIVKYVENDPIPHDALENRASGTTGSDKRYETTSYYFKINKDSSVVIVRGAFDNVSFNTPVLYDGMEKSVKENFGKAVEYVSGFHKFKNDK